MCWVNLYYNDFLWPSVTSPLKSSPLDLLISTIFGFKSLRPLVTYLYLPFTMKCYNYLQTCFIFLNEGFDLSIPFPSPVALVIIANIHWTASAGQTSIYICDPVYPHTNPDETASVSLFPWWENRSLGKFSEVTLLAGCRGRIGFKEIWLPWLCH